MAHLFSIPLTCRELPDDRQDVRWVIPGEAEAALQAHYPDPKVTLEKVFRQRLMREVLPYDWDWMLVVLPGRYPIGGFLAEARRGAKENMILMDHRLFAGVDYPAPHGPVKIRSLVFPSFPVQALDVHVSMFWVATRGLLKEFGRRSGGWLALLADRLASVPPHGTWVYLADAPDAVALASMSANNEARYRRWFDIHLGPSVEPPSTAALDIRTRMLRQCAYEAVGEQRLNLFREYLGLRCDDARAWGALAFCYHLAGQGSSAVAAARKALRFAPHWHFPGYLLMLNQGSAGHFRSVVATCRKLLEESPLDLLTLQALQFGLKQTGERTERLAVLELLCRLDENHSGNAFELGYEYFQQGNYKAAAAMFGRVVEMDPEYATAWNNFGYSLAQTGEYEIALKACTHACGMKRNASNLDSLGFVLLKLGRKGEAIDLFREALVLDPGHVEANMHLGEAIG